MCRRFDPGSDHFFELLKPLLRLRLQQGFFVSTFLFHHRGTEPQRREEEKEMRGMRRGYWRWSSEKGKRDEVRFQQVFSLPSSPPSPDFIPPISFSSSVLSVPLCLCGSIPSARTARHRELKNVPFNSGFSARGLCAGRPVVPVAVKKSDAAAGDRSFVRYGLPAINACHCRR
jgi:hypothetical protein